MEENQQPGQFVVDDPWTQSDTIQLQRLNQDLGSLDSQVNEGVLYPAEAEPEKQAILQERQSLLARQQKAQLAQKGQQRMQMQDEFANQHKMQQANMEDAAANFTKSMPLYIDPDTGEKTMFYPAGDGKFAPVPPPPPKEPQPWEQMLQSGSGTEGGGSLWQPGGLDVSADSVGAEPGSTTPKVEPPQPNPDGTHTMTIWNGRNRTDVTFDKDGKTIGATGSWMGKEGGQPPQEQSQSTDLLGFSPKDHARADQEARLMVPPPYLTGIPHQDAITRRHYNENIFKAKSAILLNQRRVQAASLADARKQEGELRKAQALGDRAFAHEYRTQFNDLQKDIDKFREKHTEAEIEAFAADPNNINKKWMWDRSAHEAEARSRAEGATFKAHGKDGWVPPSESKPAEAPKPEAKAAQSAPAVKDTATLREAVKKSIPEGFEPIPVGDNAKIDPAKNGKSAAAMQQFSAMANKAGLAQDWEGQKAANELASIVAAYGHINNVPEKQRQRIEALVNRVQKYR